MPSVLDSYNTNESISHSRIYPINIDARMISRRIRERQGQDHRQSNRNSSHRQSQRQSRNRNEEQGQGQGQAQQRQQRTRRGTLPSTSSSASVSSPSTPATNTSNPSPTSSAAAAAAALAHRVANPLDDPTTRQQIQQIQQVTREDDLNEQIHFANRVLCRTPPPVYESHSLPATPPPSYTPHSGVIVGVAGASSSASAGIVIGAGVGADDAIADGGVLLNSNVNRHTPPEIWQSYATSSQPPLLQCQPFPICLDNNNASSADYVELVLPAAGNASIEYQQQQQPQQQQQQTPQHQRPQLVAYSENVAASLVGVEQGGEQEIRLQLREQQLRQQQQQQQQLRRRRRLHLLQQQRLSNINAASTDSTSSSSNSSASGNNNNNCDFILSSISNNNNYHYEINHNNNNNGSNNQHCGSSSDSETYAQSPIGSERRRQRRQERISGCGLRDAYCPDLLNACSLILYQQHEATCESIDSSDSSAISNFTASPPPRQRNNCTAVNVENSVIRPVVRDREVERFRDLQPSGWEVQTGRAVSTPELRPLRVVYCNHSNDADDGRLNGAVGAEQIEYQRLIKQNSTQQDMGQNLSLRRPRISLTWVLREQQQQQEKEEKEKDKDKDIDKENEEVQNPTNGEPEPNATTPTTKKLSNGTAETPNNNNGYANGTPKQCAEVVPTQLTTTPTTNTTTTTTTATTKRYRLKQLPVNNDPLNGYATTPTAHMPVNALATPHKFFSNQNLLDFRDKSRPPSRELLFVCTPQRLPKSYDTNEALSLAKKRNEIRKRLAAKMATAAALHTQANHGGCGGGDGAGGGRPNADGAEATPSLKLNGCGSVAASATISTIVLEKDELKSLKGTYSEPSLIAASEGHQRRHRHRKRRERHRGVPPKFGYEINNVEDFLSKCSLAAPGNIPVVLSTATTLYQTRPGQPQTEIPLPLGMVVNAVFKNQNWLYVQTPHAEEGYVGYACCLPLGILPPSVRGGGAGGGAGTHNSGKSAPCWESQGDIFPRPGGNMTDSEKEMRLRGGTRSDGARTPRGKRDNAIGIDVDAVNGNASVISASAASTCSVEHQVDRLYLRAASQPRLVEKAYAQLKSTKQAALALRNGGGVVVAAAGAGGGGGVGVNDEYVTLQQQQQKSKLHLQKHLQQQQQLQQLHAKQLITNGGPYITNGHNGQHLHPKNANISAALSCATAASVASMSLSASVASQNEDCTSATAPANGSHVQNANLLHQPTQQAQQPHHVSVLHHMMNSRKQHGLRQTLVAINTDYTTDSIVLHKGEIVTLCECRQSKDHRQWFYVRTRDGREGYIPAEVAGHGYL